MSDEQSQESRNSTPHEGPSQRGVARVEVSADLPLGPRAIRVLRRGEPAFDLPIYPDVEYTFGRDRSCSVVIADSTVSREHGLLSCRLDGSWVYRDKGS